MLQSSFILTSRISEEEILDMNQFNCFLPIALCWYLWASRSKLLHTILNYIDYWIQIIFFVLFLFLDVVKWTVEYECYEWLTKWKINLWMLADQKQFRGRCGWPWRKSCSSLCTWCSPLHSRARSTWDQSCWDCATVSTSPSWCPQPQSFSVWSTSAWSTTSSPSPILWVRFCFRAW